MDDLRGKLVHVIGLGELGSGRAAARALAARGARVVVSDLKSQAELAPELEKLAGLPIDFRLAEQAYSGLLESELVVVSPGVPLDIPALMQARAGGIAVISEIELAYRIARAPVIAVTGTKGKTTTTTLIGRLLAAAGQRAWVGGNIGLPLAEQAEQAGPDDWLVAEVSSFQLEATERFRPRVAVLLNFFEDHLDRHQGMDSYREAKARIFVNQTSEDLAVINADDPGLAGWVQTRARVIPFSTRRQVEGGVHLEAGMIVGPRAHEPSGRPPASPGTQTICPASAVRLRGRHNLENALAAVAVLVGLGLPLGRVEAALREFRGVANRLEEVATVAGVTFVNDSQATTPVAVIRALESFSEPVVLIAGGRPKVRDFAPLAAEIARRARALVTIGEAGPGLAEQARKAGCSRVREAGSLQEAVTIAFEQADAGWVVLLSPGCASFDMFKNMSHRGQVFRQAVRKLGKQKGSGGLRV